jgi:cytoskeletal protein CcmA (bactofilin family)
MWKRERVERVDIEEVLKSAPVEAPAPAARVIESPSPAAVAPAAVAPAASATVSTLPQAPRACVLGATLRFKGDLVADEDLTIEGQIDGSVLHTRNLTIGSLGHVRGDIRARRVIVEGKVSGNVYALDSVTLRAGAVLTGDVFARRVAIEDGACISGRVDMDNAPAVPKIDAAAVGSSDDSEPELSNQEVGELLTGS